MQWNGFLADAFAWLLLIIPAGLAFAKLGFPKIPWWAVWLTALVFGWIVSVAYFWSFPSDNGFGAMFAHLFGWLVMLPFLGGVSLVWIVRAWRGSMAARVATLMLVLLSIALPLRACFLWMPEGEAKEAAEWELRQQGYKDFRVTGAQKTWNGWTVHVRTADKSNHPVYLSRSGFCTGMGG